MINMKSFLTEDRNSTLDRGCLMAMFPEEMCHIFNKYNHLIVPEENLYIKDGEFGREKECHVTIRYGFLPDLNELNVREILKGVTPFTITLNGISLFNNEKEGFDVVKYDVESDVLRKLNSLSGKFPNENKFPDYKPHMTIAYVKPGTFDKPVAKMNVQVPIKQICYSPAKGGKSYFDL
jgi:hypothetical protein